MRWTRLRKQLALLSTGGMLLASTGLAGVVSGIDYGNIFVSLFSTFLRIVITAIFGVNASNQILAGLFG